MAIKNPIDRKRKTSFLLGMVIMGVVTILVAAGMFILYSQKSKELDEEKAKIKDVKSVLSVDKKAAEEITSGDLTTESLYNTPLNGSVRANLFTPDMGDDKDGLPRKAYAKIDLPKGTIVTKDMVYYPNNESDTKINDTLRMYDILGLTLPPDLKEGDVIDVRFLHPSLPDFIVLSKKRVEKADTDTIWLKLSESEIIMLSSATIESYLIKGSKMYATIYTDPGVQKAAKITYPMNDRLYSLLDIAVEEDNRDRVFEQIKEQKEGSAATRGYFLPNYGLSSEEELITTIESGVSKDKTLREKKRAEFIQAELADK